jgi:hypothetical protein
MPSSQLKPQSGPTQFSEADHDRQRIEMAALLSAPISADMEYGIKPGENHRSGTKRTASGTVKPDENASVTALRTAVSKRDALLLEHEMLVEKTMKQYRDSLARKRGLPIPPETTNIRQPGATASDVTITTSTKSELPPLTRSSTLPNDHATSIQSVGVTRASTLPLPPPASPTRASTLPMPVLATSIRPAPSESPHLYGPPPKFLPAPTRPESEPRPRPMLQPVSQDPRRRLTTQSPASAISPLTLNSAAVPPPTDPRRRTVMQSLPVDTGSTSVSTTSDPRRRPTASSGNDHAVQTRSNLPRLSTTSLACESLSAAGTAAEPATVVSSHGTMPMPAIIGSAAATPVGSVIDRSRDPRKRRPA